MDKHFEIMYLFCYSSNDNPLALASIYDFCLNHLLLKWLPNGDFLSSSFHLCLLVGNSFPLFSIYVCIDVCTYLLIITVDSWMCIFINQNLVVNVLLLQDLMIFNSEHTRRLRAALEITFISSNFIF